MAKLPHFDFILLAINIPIDQFIFIGQNGMALEVIKNLPIVGIFTLQDFWMFKNKNCRKGHFAEKKSNSLAFFVICVFLLVLFSSILSKNHFDCLN